MATALQMISWGLEVNDYGNAQLDADGNFIKVKGEGVTEEMWAEVVAYADEQGLEEGRLQEPQPPVREQVPGPARRDPRADGQRVEDFAYKMMTEVLNAAGHRAARRRGDPRRRAPTTSGPRSDGIEDPAEWTDAKIVEKAKSLDSDKGAAGNFDD